jgi:hypothetical protein
MLLHAACPPRLRHVCLLAGGLREGVVQHGGVQHQRQGRVSSRVGCCAGVALSRCHLQCVGEPSQQDTLLPIGNACIRVITGTISDRLVATNVCIRGILRSSWVTVPSLLAVFKQQALWHAKHLSQGV